jgi:hypothetical protein
MPVAAPQPEPLALKVIPPSEPLPDLLPVATAAPAPRNEPPPADPNSVFGWGAWSGGEPAAGVAVVPAAGGNAPPRLDGLTPGLSAASPGAPAGVLPPPQSVSSIRPGHGWGDRNHIHVHKHPR